MEDYEMITRLGGGSFADVYKAREKSTGELVAIKILKKKYKKWEECIELRECKSLQILNKTSDEKGKDNIIKLKRIIFINKTGVLNLVFEFMEKDLLILMKSYEPKTLPETKIKDIIYQTLLGLAYMHKYGFFHRDLKPENLLLIDEKVKIADFGLAREIRSIPPYTEYVSTRYYRAPECILKSTNYNSPIDIWALGCVMAEMYLHPQPLFYGANEKEVLFRICSILGTPTYDTWSDGIQQANYIGFKFPNSNKIELEKIITNASEEAIDLLKQMLKWDPNQRETAANLLNHKFFENMQKKDYINSSINRNIDFNLDNCKIFYNKSNQDIKSKQNNNFDQSLNDYNNDKEKDKAKIDNNYELTDSLFTVNKDNNDNHNKNEENNFSKMLNDTDGFNKLLNQLKQEKIEEDKDFEKQKNSNNFNNLFISIEQKLDLNNYDSKPKINENIEKIKEEEEDLNTINKNKTINNEKPFSFLDEYKFNDTKNNNINNINKNNNYDNNNNTFETNNIRNVNTLDMKFNVDLLMNKDNNDEMGFENAKRLKPIVKNNRRGSARKFLEENENKTEQFQSLNRMNKNNNTNNNERKLRYNLSNNLIGNYDYDKKDYTKPTIVKNDFSFANNLAGIFDKQNKNNDIIYNYNGYKKRDYNYGKSITLANNDVTSGYYLNNKKNDNFFDKKNLRRGPGFYDNGNIWNI
jgi:serine/threonine protein kinase